MATRNIVPRASGEGQLGTSSKLWNQTHQLTSSFGTATLNEDANNKLTLSGSPLIASSGLSGSLTQLADGSSYLVEGSGVTITSGSTGQVTISATGAGSMSSFTLAGSAGSVQTISDGDTLTIAAGTNITTTAASTDTVTIALADSPTIGGNLTVTGDLTVNGTTTTIDTQNLLVEDPMVLLASGASSANQNGGLAILSGSSVSNESLVVGRVDTDMWGVGRLDVQSGAVTDLSGMTSVDFKAADLVSTTGVISGSSNKAIEFDSLGNITTLTTGSVSTNDVLKYDGTKWVADTLQDAMTITYQPNTVYATVTNTVDQTIDNNDSISGGFGVGTSSSTYTGNFYKFNSTKADTSPSSNLVDLTNNRFLIPAGVDKVKISAGIWLGSVTGENDVAIYALKYNSDGTYDTDIILNAVTDAQSDASDRILLNTSITNVSQGQYIKLWIFANTGRTIGASTANSWFSIEVVEGSMLNTTVNSTISDFTADTLTLSQGVISGSNNKAIEFDSLGNITTLTTGSVSTNDVLTYDGTKWVADTLQDTMTVTYTPKFVYARMRLSADYTAPYDNSAGISLGVSILPFDTVDVDTTSGNILTDPGNDRFIIPAGVTKVRLRASVYASNNITGEMRVSFFKNGSGSGIYYAGEEADTVGPDVAIAYSSVIDVVQGDNLQALIYTYNSARTINSSYPTTWFEMEVVEGSILNTTVNSTISDFTADTLTLSEGVISGSNNKAIEFDSLGNITTLTTGSASTNDFLKYDGTKWVADTLQNAMTVTYQPDSHHALMKVTTDYPHSGGTTQVVNFGTSVYDTDSLADTTNSRFTIPTSGVTKVRCKAAVYCSDSDTGQIITHIRHHDSTGTRKNYYSSITDIDSDGSEGNGAFTPVVEVSAGDYFQVFLYTTNDRTISSNFSWFEMEVVEGSVLNTTVNSTISDFTADTLTLSEGVISGSNNKAIEFDADGNILTLTTGSVSTNDFLKYDGTKWVAATTDAMTITYQPDPVYAIMSLSANTSIGNDVVVPYNTEQIDTSPSSNLVDTTNNRFVIPAGVTKVELEAGIHASWTSTAGDYPVYIAIKRYNSAGVDQEEYQGTTRVDNNGYTDLCLANSSLIDVQQGDYFNVIIYTGGVSRTIASTTNTYFQMKVVEGSILNKTIASTLPNAMSITYAPTPIYARMTQTTSQNLSGVDVRIQYNNLDIDTSPNSNLVDISNNRFTIPAGVTKVKILASLSMQSSDAINMLDIRMFDSGGNRLYAPAFEYASNHESGTYEFLILQSSIISVQQGYYLEIFGHATGATAANNVRTFAEMQVVEGSILNTTVASTITDFSTNKLTLTEGVISGSSNKVIEFDSLGNILTLTTGSAVQHNVLAYDGTKWVASASLSSGGSSTTDSIIEGAASVEVYDSGATDGAIIKFAVDPSNTGSPVDVWHIDGNGHLIPQINSTYDIGSAEKKVRHFYLSNNSLKFESADFGVKDGSSIPQWTRDSIAYDVPIYSGSITPNENEILKYSAGIWKPSILDIESLNGATLSTTELNYVDGVTSAIQTQIDSKAPLADPTFTGTVNAASLTLSGDLTVNGTTTTINSTTLAVDDKNIVLGSVDSPTDTTADGGGLTLKGSTDKTFNWVDSTDSWTSSEHIELAANKRFRINGNGVLSANSLGDGVVNSSLTSVGTLTDLTVAGYITGSLSGSVVEATTLKLDGTAITAAATELNYIDGVTSNIQTQLDAKSGINNIVVAVVSSGGNKYTLDGSIQQTALLPKGVRIRFDQSDSSNSSHPIAFSTGTDGSGTSFTTGITSVGTPGSAGAYTEVMLEQDSPDVLYYYCTNHSGMGGKAYSGKDLSELTATVAELNYVDGVTSNIQTQLDSKAASTTTLQNVYDNQISSNEVTLDTAGETFKISGSGSSQIVFGSSNASISNNSVGLFALSNDVVIQASDKVEIQGSGGGFLSGSSTGGDKALEWDQYGNITTIGTGSASTNDFLKYDGTKWVAATTDAMTVTYAPSVVYGRLNLATADSFNSQTTTKVDFDARDIDSTTGNILTDPTNGRLLVPAGVDKVIVKGSVYSDSSISGDILLEIKRYNSSGVEQDEVVIGGEINTTGYDRVGIFTGIQDVQQGDYFELWFTNQSTTTTRNIPVDSSYNWFEIEVVEGSILNTTVATTLPNAMSITYAPSPVYARYTLSSNTSTLGPSFTDIPWDTVDVDTTSGNILTDVSNNEFTIPAGVTKVRFTANILSSDADTKINIKFIRIRSGVTTGVAGQENADGGGQDIASLTSQIIDVLEGDTYRIQLSTDGVARSVAAGNSFFEMQVVEGSILNTTVASTIADLTVGGDLSVTGGELSAPTTGVAATGTDTLGADEYIYLANDNTTLTLPTPESGRKYLIKLAGTYSSGVTINTNNTSTVKIDGNGTQTLGSSHAFIEIVSDGSNWFIIGKDGTITGSN